MRLLIVEDETRLADTLRQLLPDSFGPEYL